MDISTPRATLTTEAILALLNAAVARAQALDVHAHNAAQRVVRCTLQLIDKILLLQKHSHKGHRSICTACAAAQALPQF
jgi:hypothetical protein